MNKKQEKQKKKNAPVKTFAEAQTRGMKRMANFMPKTAVAIKKSNKKEEMMDEGDV